MLGNVVPTPSKFELVYLKMPEFAKVEADLMPPHPCQLVTFPFYKIFLLSSHLHPYNSHRKALTSGHISELSNPLTACFGRKSLLPPSLPLTRCELVSPGPSQTQLWIRHQSIYQSTYELRNVLSKESMLFDV
jgi:hypothetical protein